MTLDDYVKLGALFDVYGALLTDRQRMIVKRAVFDDCSLFEIAEELGISRQAVRDALLTSKAKMSELDNALGIASRMKKTHEHVNALLRLCSDNAEACVILDEISTIWKVNEVDD